MSKKKQRDTYASKKLRIGKFYDVDQCVMTKTYGERISEGREKLVKSLRDPQFYINQGSLSLSCKDKSMSKKFDIYFINFSL